MTAKIVKEVWSEGCRCETRCVLIGRKQDAVQLLIFRTQLKRPKERQRPSRGGLNKRPLTINFSENVPAHRIHKLHAHNISTCVAWNPRANRIGSISMNANTKTSRYICMYPLLTSSFAATVKNGSSTAPLGVYMESKKGLPLQDRVLLRAAV